MNMFVTLGLVLVSMAVTADAAECIRQTPLNSAESCGPPRHALILQLINIVRCCPTNDLYPLLTRDPVLGNPEGSCNCVPRAELCSASPARCSQGSPFNRFISVSNTEPLRPFSDFDETTFE